MNKTKGDIMKINLLICGALLGSLVACSNAKDNNQPQANDDNKVIDAKSTVTKQSIDSHLETIEQVISNSNIMVVQIAYEKLLQLQKIDPNNIKINLYIKLLKPKMDSKGIHRKLDQLVYKTDGVTGLKNHLNNVNYNSYDYKNNGKTNFYSHTREKMNSIDWEFNRMAENSEIFKNEKEVQLYIDKQIANLQDLYLFAKKNQDANLNITKVASKDCGSEYFYYDNQGTGENASPSYSGNINGEYFSSWDLMRIKQELVELNAPVEIKESLEDTKLRIKKIEDLENAKAKHLALIPKTVFGTQTCDLKKDTYQFGIIDWKHIQAAATGMSLVLAAHNAYNLENVIELSNGLKNNGFLPNFKSGERIAKAIEIDKESNTDQQLFKNLGKIRKDNRLNIFSQSTSNLIAGVRWIWENKEISCSENVINQYGDQHCKSAATEMVKISEHSQRAIFGKVEIEDDKVNNVFEKSIALDSIVEGISGVRSTSLSVNKNDFDVELDARRLFLNPIQNLQDYTGETFDSNGDITSVKDSTANGLFKNGRLNDVLRLKSETKNWNTTNQVNQNLSEDVTPQEMDDMDENEGLSQDQNLADKMQSVLDKAVNGINEHVDQLKKKHSRD